LGLLKVAAVLEAQGHVVSVLDLSGVANYQQALAAYLVHSEDTLFGVTATTPQLPAAFEIARTIRRLRPGARLILGGPHVTLTMAAVKLEKNGGGVSRAAAAARQLHEMFDVLCAGDGEKAIMAAIRRQPRPHRRRQPSRAVFPVQ
jgi:radical SAM superfamily enzyme YgiQ (UPF0313 family)